MTILWEHLGAGRFDNLPHYDVSDVGGMTALWEGSSFAGWRKDEDILKLGWSIPLPSQHWAPVVRKLACTKAFDLEYPDAIVCFAPYGTFGDIRIAVGRTKLVAVAETRAPDWFDPPIMKGLRKRFAWLEDEDLRVGSIYLHPVDLQLLRQVEEFVTVPGEPEVMNARKVGLLWGAHVYESRHVPMNYVAVIQDGLIVQSVSKEACVPL